VSEFTYATFETTLYHFFALDYQKSEFTVLILCSGLESENYSIVAELRESQLSEYRNGRKPVSSNVRSHYSGDRCIERAADCFEEKLICDMPLHRQETLREMLIPMIVDDNSMATTRKEHFINKFRTDALSIILAELLQYVLVDVDLISVDEQSITQYKSLADSQLIVAGNEQSCIADVRSLDDTIENNTGREQQDSQPPVSQAVRSKRIGVQPIIIIVESLVIVALIVVLLIKQSVPVPPVEFTDESLSEPSVLDEDMDEDEIDDKIEIEKPAIEVPLYSRTITDVGDSGCYNVFFDSRSSTIKLYSLYRTTLSDGSEGFRNFITYAIDGFATGFTATLNPPVNRWISSSLRYSIICDGEVRYETVMECDMSPIDVDVDITGAENLTISVELVSTSHNPITTDPYNGIQNAIITTTDY